MRVVFDLDGTLALCGHRQHFIEGEHKDYAAFYAACVDDEPNWPVIWLLRSLFYAGTNRVEIWTGRRADQETATRAWLRRYEANLCVALSMRLLGDTRPDIVLKREWLVQARSEGRCPDLVFEDRTRCVEMWRSEGIACFQVAAGNY